MRKKKPYIIIFIVGLFILSYPYIARRINTSIQEKQSQEFLPSQGSQLIDKSPEEIVEIKVVKEKTKQCNMSISSDFDSILDPFAEQPEEYQQSEECRELYDGEIFAVLEIPKLNSNIPIYLGASQYILSKGVGQIEGSSLPIGGQGTHTVLSGHRGMVTMPMFRDLDELHEGDLFYVHLLDETLTYRVYAQKVVEPNETMDLEIQNEKDLATLYTCHPYLINNQRLLIQAERLK